MSIREFCNANIMRELQGIIDDFNQKWAGNTKELFEEVYTCVFVENDQFCLIFQ